MFSGWDSITYSRCRLLQEEVVKPPSSVLETALLGFSNDPSTWLRPLAFILEVFLVSSRRKQLPVCRISKSLLSAEGVVK